MAQERRKITEKKILNAALTLFVRKGYNGTSIDEITRAAELTKGALYGHFESKAHLVLKLIDEFKVLFIDEMIKATNQENLSALDKIHKVMSFNAELAIKNQSMCVFPTFLTFELNDHEMFKGALKTVHLEYRANIVEIIKQGQREGSFKKDLDPDLTALAFISLHDGALLRWFLNKNIIDGKKFVQTFRTIFLQGIQTTTGDN